MPDVFPEVAIFDGKLWIGTSFEHSIDVIVHSRLTAIGGVCEELLAPLACTCYSVEQLTDEFGDPIENIDDLYPPPLRIEVE